MRQTIVGFQMFFVPAVIVILPVLRGGPGVKAISVSIFRGFAPIFITGGVLYLAAGLGLLRLPR